MFFENSDMGARDSAGHFLAGHSSPGPGRDSLYEPSMNEVVRKLALLGLTDEQLAGFLEVSARTLNRWKSRYPAFRQSLMAGKVVADANVAEALYRSAVGQWIETETVYRVDGGRLEVIGIKSYRPPDPGAAKLWLINRRPKDWRRATGA